MAIVSTSDMKPVILHLSVTGMALDEVCARKLAKAAKNSLCYELGVECDALEVEVEVSDEVEAEVDEAEVDEADEVEAEAEGKEAPMPKPGTPEWAAMKDKLKAGAK